MSRYDGLIIPRSYSEYINKTDAATLLQALQLSGVMDAAPTSGSNHPVKSGGVFTDINIIKSLLGVQYNDTQIETITEQVTTDLGVEAVLAYRHNNIVYMFIQGTYTGTPTTSTQLLVENLPEKYRTNRVQTMSGVAYATTQPYIRTARITVNLGNIEMSETDFITGCQIRIGIMYMI